MASEEELRIFRQMVLCVMREEALLLGLKALFPESNTDLVSVISAGASSSEATQGSDGANGEAKAQEASSAQVKTARGPKDCGVSQ